MVQTLLPVFATTALTASSFTALLLPHQRKRANAKTTTERASTSAAIMTPPNQLLRVPALRNAFYALRHGQSLANAEGIISSDPAISTIEHGLSETGIAQAKNAAGRFASEFDDEKFGGVAVYTSDFKRASETAECMAEALAKSSVPLYGGDIIHEKLLRERFFGGFNGRSDGHYEDVWGLDVTDPDHTEFGVESVNSVMRRTTGLVLDIDADLSPSMSDGEQRQQLPWKCVLVAHGDVLQILQTGFRKMDGSLHRTLPHLETATIRQLELASGEPLQPCSVALK